MHPGRLLRILFSYITPHKTRVIGLVATLIIEGTFSIFIALSLKFIIDYAIIPRNFRALVFILVGLVGGFLLTATSQVIRDYLYAWFGSRVLCDLRKEMFRHLQNLSLSFYSRTRTGDIASRFSTDLAAVENAVVLGIPGASLSVINILFSTSILFVLDWRLALAAIVGFPLCAIGPKLPARRALGAGYQMRVADSDLTSAIHENLGAQPIVKAFSLKRSVVASFERQSEKLAGLATRFNFLSYTSERSPNIAMLLFNVVLISGGSYFALKGSLSSVH